jgi:putative ABC transport system ATP-binding protein
MARNLVFRYGNNYEPVIDIPDFTLKQGEMLLLKGPSGSGKTTFLGLVAGILLPTGGELNVLGHSMTKLSARQRDALRAEHVGYIFQMLNLIPYLTVRENMELPCHLHEGRMRRVGSGDLRKKTLELAEALGVDALLDRPVTRLSVGQQQRVAAVRALLGEPELVIADEPTSALDADTREAFLEILFAQCKKRGSALLFVSHDSGLESRFPKTLSLSSMMRSSTERGESP